MQALILGAGAGRRLQPLTALLAKPAVRVVDKPLVWHTLAGLTQLKPSRIFMTLYHRAESVLALGLEQEFPLQFVIEDELLGTGGGIRNVARLLDDDLLLVCNGDTLWDFDLRGAVDAHRRSGQALTLVLTPTSNWRDYSAVRLDAAGRIARIGTLFEAPDAAGGLSAPYTFAGISIVDTSLLERLPARKVFDFVTDFIIPLLRAGEPVNGFVAAGFWSDMGTPRRYIDGCLRYAERTAQASAGYVAGKDCAIHPRAELSRSVLWNDVRLAAPLSLERCIVIDDVLLDLQCELQHSLILPAAMARPELAAYRPMRARQALILPLVEPS